jgi:NAD(P)-dependent dehydrogenase (short-subunit alcohol dehydrogenase family)
LCWNAQGQEPMSSSIAGDPSIRRRAVAEEATGAGRYGTIVIAADVADEQDRRKLVRAAFDTGRIDALVNNAGADLLTTQLRDAEFSLRN